MKRKIALLSRFSDMFILTKCKYVKIFSECENEIQESEDVGKLLIQQVVFPPEIFN